MIAGTIVLVAFITILAGALIAVAVDVWEIWTETDDDEYTSQCQENELW